MLKFWRRCLLFFCSKDSDVKRYHWISILKCEFLKVCNFTLDKSCIDKGG